MTNPADPTDDAFAARHRAAPGDNALLLEWAAARRKRGDLPGASQLVSQALTNGAGVPGVLAMAALLIDVGNPEQAAKALAATQGRGGAELRLQLGRLAELKKDYATANEAYRDAIRLDPKAPAPRVALAKLQFGMGQVDEAEVTYRALLARHPDEIDGLTGLAYILGLQRRLPETFAIWERLEKLGRVISREIGKFALNLAFAIEWESLDPVLDWITRRIGQGGPYVVDPFPFFVSRDDPALHRMVAAAIAAAVKDSVAGLPRPVQTPYTGGRIRVGYIAGDLHQHPTSDLLAGVLEAHDRSRFEITAYDYSVDDGTPMRARMKAAFEHFVPIADRPPEETAARIAADGINILVDLVGFTDRSASRVLALRPAPVQINFLGYIFSQGADWIDGIIADDIVLPLDQQVHWPERILHMPLCCYPSERARPRPVPDTDRTGHGLPADGVVFVCFNSTHKITPAIFAAWVRILNAVPGSTLWLFAATEVAEPRLRRRAEAAGLAQDRLVFAPHMKLDEHIARYACADLFLDTTPYNAHTTAVDSLWAGVPVLTLPGRTFASRVGASLLRAVDLPELVASSLDDYVDKAIALAQHPERLAALRAHLLAARDTAPLYDAPAFARGLEGIYERLVTSPGA